jgi:hypothetical protein
MDKSASPSPCSLEIYLSLFEPIIILSQQKAVGIPVGIVVASHDVFCFVDPRASVYIALGKSMGVKMLPHAKNP